MAADDCRRLAYHAFGLEDDGIFPAAKLQAAFENAARLCPAELAKERARLHIRAAEQATSQQKDVIAKGGKADKALTVLIVRVNEMLDQEGHRDGECRRPARPAGEFFLAARQTLPQLAPTLRQRWMAIADAATANPEFAPADQLAAQLMKITRRQGVRGGRQGAHRCAQRGARDRARRCWPSSRMPTCVRAW